MNNLPFPLPTTTASYYLRSSVLGGRTITEYDAAGARHISYTYAGGGVLTETTKTYNDAPWQQWRHTNPVTGDAVNTDTQGKQTGLTRLDPAGTNVGESDPFIDTGGGGGGGGESPAEADRVGLLPIGAGWGGSGGGSSGMRCNLDGVEIGCGWVMQMMDIGAAEQCPNNDCGPRSVTVNITYESGRRETHRGLVNNPFFNVNETFTGLQGRLAAIGFSDMSHGFSWAVRNAVSSATLGSLADGGRNGTQGASFFAPPQNSGFRFGNVAFSEEQQKILAQSFSRINQDNCKGFINKTLADHSVGKNVNTLEKLLNSVKFNFYDTGRLALIAEEYSPAELGVGVDATIKLQSLFVSASAVTIVERGGINTFLSSKVFDRPWANSLRRYGYGGRYADTSTAIVHELFHAAGIDASKVDSQSLQDKIRNHCGLSGADRTLLTH